jgi:hypothetical protein
MKACKLIVDPLYYLSPSSATRTGIDQLFPAAFKLPKINYMDIVKYKKATSFRLMASGGVL